MAYEQPGFCITLKAPSTVFSTWKFYAVKGGTAADTFAAPSTDGRGVLGILQDGPVATGEATNVMVAGISKVQCNSTAVTISDFVWFSTAGTALSSTNTGCVPGTITYGPVLSGAPPASTAGCLITVLIDRITHQPNT